MKLQIHDQVIRKLTQETLATEAKISEWDAAVDVFYRWAFEGEEDTDSFSSIDEAVDVDDLDELLELAWVADFQSAEFLYETNCHDLSWIFAYDGSCATNTLEEATIATTPPEGKLLYVVRGEHRGRLLEDDGELVKVTEVLASFKASDIFYHLD